MRLDSYLQPLIDAGLAKGLLTIEYGNKRIDRNMSSFDANTPFPVGSFTKVFVALAIHKLCEEEKLSLDTPVSQYFPEYFKNSAATVADLLSHTSGLSKSLDWTLYLTFSQQNVSAAFANLSEPLAEANTVLTYSNTGFYLLGLLIETLTKQTWHDYINDTILSPLGMNNTHFENTTLRPTLLGSYGTFTTEPLKNCETSSAGGMLSSSHDLLTFHNAIADNRGDIITPEIRNLMTTPRPIKHSNQLGRGMGFKTVFIEGQRFIYHGGCLPDGYYMSSMATRYGGKSIRVNWLSNASPNTQFLIEDCVSAALQDRPNPVPNIPKITSLTPELALNYKGVFTGQKPNGEDITIDITPTEHGLVFEPRELSEGETQYLYPTETPDTFIFLPSTTRLVFSRDSHTNAVTHYTLITKKNCLIRHKISD